MNHILEVRQNIFYVKETSEGETQKVHELIFLSHKPEYSMDSKKDILRKTGIVEHRFHVLDEMYDDFIKLITSLKDSKEEDLK